MILTELLSLPRAGVVVLIKGDSVLISYTTNMASELCEIFGQFWGQDDIELKVFSAGADIETLKLHTEYYRHYYKSLGMKSLSEYRRKTLAYKARIVPTSDFRYVDVQLVTARGDSRVVGRFKSTTEAKSFIEAYYGPDNEFKFPVYAINQETKQLLTNKPNLLKLK